MARVFIGTPALSAPGAGHSFPESLPLKRPAAILASQFDSVELNGVFYRTPGGRRKGGGLKPERTSSSTWKRSKFITHWKRLSNASSNSLVLAEQA